MKKSKQLRHVHLNTFIFLIFFSSNFILNGQEVFLNTTNNVFEYSHVKPLTDSLEERQNMFSNKLKELNYSNIEQTKDNIKGESFFSKLIMGSAMEIHYQVLILFKEDKYKLVINKFSIKDVRFGTMPLEDLRKNSQKRWIDLINEKLPSIIANIEGNSDW